jgi:hypothetical protein
MYARPDPDFCVREGLRGGRPERSSARSERVTEHDSDQVTVTGTVVKDGGVQMIYIESAE